MHTNSQAPSPATTIAERLSGGEPYIITFGGQATPWRQTLADLAALLQKQPPVVREPKIEPPPEPAPTPAPAPAAA